VRTGGILTGGGGGIEGIVVTMGSGRISENTVAGKITVRRPKTNSENRIAFFGADNRENAQTSFGGLV